MGSSDKEQVAFATEESYERNCVYVVLDQDVGGTLTDYNAEASLPRNLMFRRSEDSSSEVSTKIL